MIIPKVLAGKIEEHGASRILKIIQSWERRRARDRQRYEERKEKLKSLS
jgi:hypothetical protein